MEGEILLFSLSKKYIENPTEENKEEFLDELNSTNSSVTMTYVLSAVSRMTERVKNVDALTFVISSIMNKMENYKATNTIFDEEERVFRQI